MERASSVRHSTTVTTPPIMSDTNMTSVRHEVDTTNMATYNRQVDSNIFALDDAAARCENIDDLLADFGMNLSQILGNYNPQSPPSQVDVDKDTRLLSPSQTTLDDEEQPLPQAPAGISGRWRKSDFGTGEVEIKAMQRKLADGRMVFTKVTRGPVKHVKRVVKVSRETPEGPQLIATFETTPDTDVNQILQTVPLALNMSLSPHAPQQLPTITQPVQHDPANQPSQPSNNTTNQPSQPNCNINSHVQFSLAPKENVGPSQTVIEMPEKCEDPDEQLPLNFDTSPPKTPPSSRLAESLNASNIFAQAFFRASLKRPSSIYSVDEMQDITNYDKRTDGCWSRCLKFARNFVRRQPEIKLRHGISGMTSLDMNADDAVPSTGMSGLVVTYAKMLFTNRVKFIETLFRSVKLNRLDVVRVLCKIVSKSGLRLGYKDLREPESSATVLHVALLYNHTDVARFLLGLDDRDLILAKYTTDEYRNQTSLHVAVANGNNALVDSLLSALSTEDRTSLINTVADGNYFQQEHPHGQLCLTAAAWSSNGDVIKTLAKHGADLTLKNLKGNTLLHSIVMQAAQNPRRLDYNALIKAVWEAAGIWAAQCHYETKNANEKMLEQEQMQIDHFRHLLSIRNYNGHTPLTLAASRSPSLFKYMLEMEKIYKIPQNKLGSIAWVTYDVTDITSYAHGSYNKFSALHILAHNSQRLSRRANLDANDTDYDPLEMEPIRTMVLRKWRVYRWVYIWALIVHVFYMISFTSCTLDINSKPLETVGNVTMEQEKETQSWYAIFLPMPVLAIIMELVDLCGNYPYRMQFLHGRGIVWRMCKSIKSQWTITGNGPYRLVHIGFSISTMYWYYLYMTSHRHQEMALALSLLLGWIYVLFFTRACRVTCRFAIMIQKMFFRDLIYFMTVYAIVLISFSFAINAMYAANRSITNTLNKVSPYCFTSITNTKQVQLLYKHYKHYKHYKYYKHYKHYKHYKYYKYYKHYTTLQTLQILQTLQTLQTLQILQTLQTLRTCYKQSYFCCSKSINTL